MTAVGVSSGSGSIRRPSPDLRSADPVDWLISDQLVDYEAAVQFMEKRAAAIALGQAPELVWLLEHPPLYTAGSSASNADLLSPDRFPVYRTGRGGRHTYHGPGQRIAYVMLDLNRRGRDVRAFVGTLEAWIIETLGHFNVRGETRPDRVGVWVRRPHKGPGVEEKIAPIGVRLKRWVSLHGLAINVDPDLEHFAGIVPCGVAEHGVTSLADLGLVVSMAEVDMALAAAFETRLGPTRLISSATAVEINVPANATPGPHPRQEPGVDLDHAESTTFFQSLYLHLLSRLRRAAR